MTDSLPRAKPLPLEERRAALIAATLPLVLEFGTQLTTRQIAAASGVAEGTIFRAFPDKDALIKATVEAALDPAPLLGELAQVDLALPVRDKLIEVTTIVQRRLSTVIRLMMMVRMSQPPRELDERHKSRRANNDLIHAAVIRLLEPDRNSLRLPPETVARFLRLLTFSSSHPFIADGTPPTPAELVDVLLDGVGNHLAETT